MSIIKRSFAMLLCIALVTGLLPVHTIALDTGKETVTVSCDAGYFEDGTFHPNSDVVSAKGIGLIDISAVWADGYDSVLMPLYGESCMYSPYMISVGGYSDGDPITITYSASMNIFLQDGIRVYYLSSEGKAERITDITVTETEIDELPYLQVTFTTDRVGIFVFGNIDDSIEPDPEETNPETTVPETTAPEETTAPADPSSPSESTEPAVLSWNDEHVTIYAAAVGLTTLTAEAQTASDLNKLFGDYVCYAITPEGHAAGETVYYGIELPENYDFDNIALYEITSEGCTALEFTTDGNFVDFQHDGPITVACGVKKTPVGYGLKGKLTLSGALPTDCFVGDTVALSGVTVTATYTKADCEDVTIVLHPGDGTIGYAVMADTSAVGEQTVYITYGTAMASFPINIHQEQFSDSSTGVEIDVEDFGVTGVTVTPLSPEDHKAHGLIYGFEGLVAYDIDLEGHQQGDVVMLTLPIPEGWDPSRLIGVSVEDGLVKTIHGTAADGMFTFPVDHFSAKGIALLAEGTTPEKGYLVGSSIYTLDTNGVTANKKYLIVNTNSNGTGHALTNNSGSVGETDVTISNGQITVADDSKIAWTFSDSTSGTVGNNGSYLYPNRSSLALYGTGTKLSISNQNGGAYRIRYYYYLRYNGGWTGSNSRSNVYLYEYTGTTSGKEVTFSVSPGALEINLGNTPDNTALLTGTVTVDGNTVDLNKCEIGWSSADTSIATVNEGTVTGISAGSTTITATLSKADGVALQENLEVTIPVTVNFNVHFTVEPQTLTLTPNESEELQGTITVNGQTVALSDCKINWSSENEDIATVNEGTVTGVSDGDTKITATLSEVNGVILQSPISVEVPVSVATRQPTQIELINNSCTVYVGTALTESTKILMNVTYDDNTTDQVEITLDMLYDSEGNPVSTEEPGFFPGLIVKYKNLETGVFALNVVARPDNNYPEYPNPGSVDVEKVLSDSSIFQESGIVEIELSTSGVPVKAGLDVVLTIDVSNSMCWAEGTKTYAASNKLTSVMNSVKEFAEILLAPNEDGTKTNNTITIVIFAGYDKEHWGGSAVDDIDSVQTLVTKTSNLDVVKAIANNTKFSSENNLQIGYITDISKANEVNAVQIAEGTNQGNTNYDYAFWQTRQAIIEGNLGDNDREIHIVFMSDGCPSNYNNQYYRTKNVTNYHQPGTTRDYEGSSYDTGLAWTNYLLKTSIPTYHGNIYANELYEIVDGFYAVGFDMDQGSFSGIGTWEDTADWGAIFNEILSESVIDENGNPQIGVADGLVPVTEADDSDALSKFYRTLANSLRMAASEAYFVDQMGRDFDLQMGSVKLDNGEIFNPQIQISTYNVYKKAQIGTVIDGHTVTQEDVGLHYGSPNVIETVTFNADGTKAYSSLSGDSNILVDGVICAKNFWYNTTTADKTIDTNGDGTPDTPIPAEAFHWNIGTINEMQFVLSYHAYLDGSMVEPGVPAGTYDTNTFATLYYKNWLDNPAQKSVDSPSVPWQSASVYYGFYLVDEDGNPVTNRATGHTGSFYDAVKVTRKTLYKDFNLNTGNSIESAAEFMASEILPQEYTLYDKDAKFYIFIDSGGKDSKWIITKGADLAPTTYVTDYRGSEATRLDANTGEDGALSPDGIDFTGTTVWFAVLYKHSAVPDTVVIDFGLDVEIDVMSNDMFGSLGTLYGVGPEYHPEGENLFNEYENQDFGLTHTSTFGTATVSGSKVRYSLHDKNMTMDSYDRFGYEVRFDRLEDNVSEFYYSTVTVIPATTIYYEDEYVSLSSQTRINEDSNEWNNNEGTGWSVDGETDADAIQAEDRPGYYSLSDIDANNIYGYDPAYDNYSKYSLASSAKITVNSTTRGEAAFEFYGTGFDVISVTSKDTGIMIVQLYEWDNEKAAYKEDPKLNYIVDTYYGYIRSEAKITFTGGKWVCSDATADQFSGDFPPNPVEGTTVNGYVWKPVGTNNPNALYQVPVMKVSGQPYGRYKAVIQVRYSSTFDHPGDGSYDFYLDAIRIYDPAGKDPSGEPIKDAYQADGEYKPTYMELRNQIISANTFDVLDSAEVSGIVFIDGVNTCANVDDYKNFGPNNELYLAEGQAVSFTLDAQNAVSVQIGLKSVGGNTFNAEIWSMDKSAIVKDVFALSTATDMNYSITKHNGKTVVIQNTGDGILSITTLKFTYKTAGDAQTAPVLSVNQSSINAVLMLMRTPKPTEPPTEPTVPEPTVPEATVPEATVPEPTVPKKPGSGNTDYTPSETKPVETEPVVTEPEATEPEATEYETEASGEPTAEPTEEPVGDKYPTEENTQEQETEAAQHPVEAVPEKTMSFWQFIVDILASFFHFIASILGIRK